MKGLLISLAVVILLIPTLVFINVFYNSPISDDLSNWSEFANYFSGTTNTIISLFSLIVLSYITLLVYKETKKDNLKQNLMIKKLEAYRDFATIFPDFNKHLKEFSLKSKKYRTIDEDPNVIRKYFEKEVAPNLFHLRDIHLKIFTFNVVSGHLFEYDFDQKKFKTLLKYSNSLNDLYLALLNSIYNLETKNYDEVLSKLENIVNRYSESLTKFVNDLREELVLTE